mmetsp:Transcript_62946/g.132861  ORF Transcript_62946/g.132861 Transcript_62946/m.132861 type:complete len:214 (-) Transcript_62946:300-941(-)
MSQVVQEPLDVVRVKVHAVGHLKALEGGLHPGHLRRRNLVGIRGLELQKGLELGLHFLRGHTPLPGGIATAEVGHWQFETSLGFGNFGFFGRGLDLRITNCFFVSGSSNSGRQTTVGIVLLLRILCRLPDVCCPCFSIQFLGDFLRDCCDLAKGDALRSFIHVLNHRLTRDGQVVVVLAHGSHQLLCLFQGGVGVGGRPLVGRPSGWICIGDH